MITVNPQVLGKVCDVQFRKGNYWAVLSTLIIERKLEKVAEIGVLRGECAQNILRSPATDIIKDYIAIDPWRKWKSGPEFSRKTQKDWDDDYKCVLQYIQRFPQLRIIRLPSLETAPLFKDGYFDLVFIDGDHSYDAVIANIKAWIPKVRDGGILCGHDYVATSRRRIGWYDVIHAVDDFLGDKKSILDDTVWAVEVPI
jgi:hypothetical protein